MCNRKNEYKDINRWRETCRKQKAKYYGKTSFIYGKRGWTEEEDVLVLKHEISDTELSAMIHRSVGAIQKRRCRIKNDYQIRQKEQVRIVF